jgi:hypothetical protein
MTLSRKGVPFQAVVTTLWFDHEVAYPKLMFKPARYLNRDEAEAIGKLIGIPKRGVPADLILDQICGIPASQQIRPQAAAPVTSPPVTPPPVTPAPVTPTVAAAQLQPEVPGGMFDGPQASPAATPQAEPAADTPAPRRRSRARAAAQPAAEQPAGVMPDGAAHAGVTVVNGSVAQGVDALLGGLPDVPGI